MSEKNKKTSKKSLPTTREERLSEALRANLRRRKAATKKKRKTIRSDSSNSTDDQTG